MSALVARLTPAAYRNLMADRGKTSFSSCRLGADNASCFSGLALVADFCAHAHRDSSNAVGGCTAILTLASAGGDGTAGQLHVLPHYLTEVRESNLQINSIHVRTWNRRFPDSI